MSQKIIVYGTPMCAMVAPVRRTLERANADFEYIDIHRDRQAKERVREINRGYESVPTLVFSDGSTLTEPSADELEARLETLGYTVPPPTRVERVQLFFESPLTRLLGIVLLVIGLSNGTNSLIIVGALILILGLLMGRLPGTGK